MCVQFNVSHFLRHGKDIYLLLHQRNACNSLSKKHYQWRDEPEKTINYYTFQIINKRTAYDYLELLLSKVTRPKPCLKILK